MEIVKERDMKLLSRKRLYVMIDDEGPTPSRQELIDKVAKKLKVKPEQVVIKHVYPQYGSTKTKLIVHIYDDSKKIGKFEHKSLVKKHQKKPAKEEEKVEESAAEEKEEKPVEKAEEKEPEKKEEKKEESPEKEEKKEQDE